MSSRGRIRLKDVWAMLDACCPDGYERKAGNHYWKVSYRGKVWPTLPKGEHGKKPAQAEVQIPQVRKMAKELGILTCAQERLEQLR